MDEVKGLEVGRRGFLKAATGVVAAGLVAAGLGASGLGQGLGGAQQAQPNAQDDVQLSQIHAATEQP